jgi:hypothetical protein
MEEDDLPLQPKVALKTPSKPAEASRSLMLPVYALVGARIKVGSIMSGAAMDQLFLEPKGRARRTEPPGFAARS